LNLLPPRRPYTLNLINIEKKIMGQLAFQSASDLLKAIRERRLDSLELLDHYIHKDREVQPGNKRRLGYRI
jgi:hypothetical protein